MPAVLLSLPLRRRALLAATVLLPLLSATPAQANATLLNVSYDVSREFYKDYNAVFAAHWKKTTGEDLVLNQSHGGSSRQARRQSPTPHRSAKANTLGSRLRLRLEVTTRHSCPNASRAARRHRV
jgi:hypothetical protein